MSGCGRARLRLEVDVPVLDIGQMADCDFLRLLIPISRTGPGKFITLLSVSAGYVSLVQWSPSVHRVTET
jgi:hypothetical protein